MDTHRCFDPPPPAPALLPQTLSSLSPFLSSRRFPEKEGVVSFLFLKISLLFRPSYRNYHRFSSPSLSLFCSSPVSLIFLARVGQTFSLSVEFVKATIRRMRSPRSWRELTRLSLCFVCLSFEDGSGSRKEKFVSSRISRRGREER